MALNLGVNVKMITGTLPIGKRKSRCSIFFMFFYHISKKKLFQVVMVVIVHVQLLYGGSVTVILIYNMKNN
jgi:hypothetical protein